ncbi:MAG: hypothetical protein A2W93_13115 [Bacteroidetes bacterium GWF2_43_63]|nr:MAG: hypothetical protein A2W94_03490 [Bacteroidetes bacterium GWE2_42_42]OFY55123.1 MAG: hypothetical protein A2W93_13115 [Bacteroidetes bacterium GWF2_43_63]HBG70258.1 radical SAM protein [Bacteroidales bacterium]HCB63070.1 radical SAM protein [Bacteroidales bacterium]HCY22711.1 radical SAM protein [Bacteroidales bacterium]
METITRKTLIYKSGLGMLCINHVRGCSHGCHYPCYAFMIAHSHQQVKSYDEWCNPQLVSNAAELLTKELSRKRKMPDRIHLCLSTDPFMYGYPEVTEITLKLIRIMNSCGVHASVLTKGILPEELADEKIYSNKNTYGISLISLNEDFRKRWEPGAATYFERIAALKKLSEKGFPTLVHMEPYPTPNIIQQDLGDILEAVSFADTIQFGGWNYNNLSKQFSEYKQFYTNQASLVKRFCKDHNIHCETF